MTESERSQLLVTARFLNSGRSVDWLSTAITIIATAALFFGTTALIPAGAALVLGVVAKFYAIRIGFDARLFDDVASDRLTTEDVDAALGTLFHRQTTGRSWPERCRGAVRLVTILALATTLQAIAVLSAILLRR